MVGLTSIFGNHDVPKLGSTNLAPGEMNEDEKNQVKDSLQKFTELAKRLEEVAEKVFGSLGDKNLREAWKETLSAVTATGDFIDGIEHSEDGPEDTMKAEMDTLAAELETLLSKVSINIEKMKTLSEKNFCNEVLNPTYLLTRYMKNCVAHPEKESTDRFDEVYEDHTPLKVSYSLLSCLRIQGTNPVKPGIQKWKQSIQLVIGLLMYVEAFARGLQGTESELNLDLIIKACVKIFDIMKNWEEGNSEEEEEESKRREEEERKRKEEEEAKRREEEERKQREEEEKKRKEEEERRRREEEEQKRREEEERKRKEEEERKKKEEEERKRQEEEERKRREEEESKKNLWPNLKIWTEQFLINNTQMPNGQKANEIRDKVGQVLSGTAFFVALFDEARPQIDYSYYNPNGDNQLISILAKGGCDCLIYRSLTGSQESAQNHANLKSRVQSYKIGKVSYNRTLEGAIEKQILPNESWRNNFVLLVWTQKNTEFIQSFALFSCYKTVASPPIPRHSSNMTNEEEIKRSEIFKKSSDIAKNLMVIADTFLPQFNDEKVRQAWEDKLSVVTEAGNVVRGFENGSGNQMAKNMLELAGEVEKLCQKICTNVANKKLPAEKNFCKKVLSSIYLLARYMKDFIALPGKKSQEKFQNAYGTHGPLKLVYLLTSILEIQATNPLKTAMAAENGKTKATFQMWEDTIKFCLSLLMFIEAFAGGQFLDLMLGKTGKVVKDLAMWKEDYKKNEGYWTEMHAYLPKWLNENSKLSNKEKADHIKAKMDSYLTNDAFYISVFDHYYYNKNQYWDDIRVGNDQFISCYGPGGGNNFVYRSKLANKAGLAIMEEFRRKVQSYKSYQYKDKIIDALSKNPIPNVGFYIVYGGLNEEIRDSNFTLRVDGPGWWTYSFDFGGPHERKLFIGYL